MRWDDCCCPEGYTAAFEINADHRSLRQTEGLIGSMPPLPGLDLAVPAHSTLARRAEMLEVARPRPGSAPVDLLVDSMGRSRAEQTSGCRRSMP